MQYTNTSLTYWLKADDGNLVNFILHSFWDFVQTKKYHFRGIRSICIAKLAEVRRYLKFWTHVASPCSCGAFGTIWFIIFLYTCIVNISPNFVSSSFREKSIKYRYGGSGNPAILKRIVYQRWYDFCIYLVFFLNFNKR